MRALVVGAAFVEGSAGLLPDLADECDVVIAADAAGEWCLEHGIRPDLVIGDFDSSSEGAIERLKAAGVEVRVFPSRKDASDLDLAIEAAREAGARHVLLTACLARRLDHSLAALGTIARAADLLAEAHEPTLDVWAVSAQAGARRISLPCGSTVSVFGIGPVSGVSLRGFEYGLEDASVETLSSLGLSNRNLAETVSVTVGVGTVLVVHVRDQLDETLVTTP